MNLVSINKKKGIIASRGDKVARFADFGGVEIPNCAFLFQNSTNEGIPNVFTDTNFSVAERCNNMFNNTLVERVFLPQEINVIHAWSMFDGCSKLVYVSKFSMPRVIFANAMFFSCDMLEDLELGDFGIKSYHVPLYNMFEKCSSLKTLKIGDIGKCDDSHSMFADCSKLESLDIGDCSRFVSSESYEVFQWAFVRCNSLVDFKVKALPNENLVQWGMRYCENLSAQSVVNIIAALPLNKKGCSISFNKNVEDKDIEDNVYTAFDIVAEDNLSMYYSEWLERLIYVKDWNVSYV